MSGEVYFLHAGKHQSFLQVHAVIFDGSGLAGPKYTDLIS